METFDAIRTVLAVRRFKDTPIPDSIVREIVEAGHGQLDEGDWGAATDEQRSAAVELSGRKRLYITLT